MVARSRDARERGSYCLTGMEFHFKILLKNFFIGIRKLWHWSRKWQPTPVFLSGESHGQGSLVGSSSWGCRKLGTTESNLASCGIRDLWSLLWHEGPLSRGMQSLSCGMWDLVSWPGIETGSPALGVRSLSHWTTREVPLWNFSLERWKKILGMDDGDDWTTVWM